jgi:DNA-directed RNA polymerase specialized sigma24 family protein
MTWDDAPETFLDCHVAWNGLSTLLSKPIWRDGPMTNHRSALTVIGDHLAQLGRSKEGRRALQRFAAAGLCMEGADDVPTLFGQCARRPARRIQVLETLLSLAPNDETAALSAVLLLRPVLQRMARLLAGRPFDPEEAEAELVAVALAILTQGGAGRRGPKGVQAVIDATWTEARRTAGLRRQGDAALVPWSEALDSPEAALDPAELHCGLLAEAVAQGVLRAEQAWVIVETRVNERPLSEVARALARPYDAVRMERQRAEAALRDVARSGGYVVDGFPSGSSGVGG